VPIRSPDPAYAFGGFGVPRQSLLICLGIALLAPCLGSLPDIPFGHWRSIFSGLTLTSDLLGSIVGGLFLVAIIILSISPVFLAGIVLENDPLAYWMSLAAYLGTVLMGYGSVYRALAGDGLELLVMLMFAADAACGGAAIGWLLDRLKPSSGIQRWTVRMALAAAVIGSLTWSLFDASTFELRKLAWQAKRQTPGQAEPPMACLGHASADGAIRLFDESECTRHLGGKFQPDGECLKEQGGSYSWDLRAMNRGCPRG
jgi:hypothetical protein